ncbi:MULTISPECIES: hypothetical protein [Streptomyces]|uniref:hypothetical protein n=1 Tax=Streptomyces TaxID=1883 RepID=UPI000E67874F|nr:MULTISPECIES: hypothetical protein [Streptomyces]MDX3067591.1 hypothetical protein [Streptomyces sp. ND04-05B]MDX3519693.1 hypothetical protein [Streptomyces scabiei]
MDPISVALLGALAGGAGGEAGRQAWAALTALVRSPLRGGQRDVEEPAGSGEAELVRLEEEPADPAHARSLSTALSERAATDAEFSAALQRWHDQARLVRTGDGEVSNTISGGTFSGPVLQGRDFSGTSFTTPAAPPPSPGTNTATSS